MIVSRKLRFNDANSGRLFSSFKEFITVLTCSEFLTNGLTGWYARVPTGQVLKISRGATFHDGRIESIDNVTCTELYTGPLTHLNARYSPVRAVGSQ